jgi:hypothetical protein
LKLQIKKIDLFTFLETSIIFAMKNEIGERAVVIVTCGFIKKSNKTPNSFIENAIKIKHKYYIEKSNANENL